MVNTFSAGWIQTSVRLSWLPHSSLIASRRSPVVVMQAVEHRACGHRAAFRGSGRAPCRDELADSLVSPGLVEIANVVDENLEQVTLAEDEHVIEALAAHAAQEPLTESVGLRRSCGRFQDSRAHTSRDAVEVAGCRASEARRECAPRPRAGCRAPSFE